MDNCDVERSTFSRHIEMNESFPIGGFMGQEDAPDHGEVYHETLALNTGRACLALILKETKAKKIYIPHYICDSVLQSILQSDVSCEFYALDNNFEIRDSPDDLAKDELLLYVNYFGIKDQYVAYLRRLYRDQIIVDNTHAFFNRGSQYGWSFNSARKFFGVTDGAYLYEASNIVNRPNRRATFKSDYLEKRKLLGPEAAYVDYLRHESSLDCEVLKISTYSQDVLSTIDYRHSKKRRLRNFNYLHARLNSINRLKFSSNDMEGPLYYPFLWKTSIRNKLIGDKIFVPCLWEEVLGRSEDVPAWESELVENLMPLPVDHRYSEIEMEKIIATIMATIGL